GRRQLGPVRLGQPRPGGETEPKPAAVAVEGDAAAQIAAGFDHPGHERLSRSGRKAAAERNQLAVTSGLAEGAAEALPVVLTQLGTGLQVMPEGARTLLANGDCSASATTDGHADHVQPLLPPELGRVRPRAAANGQQRLVGLT